MPGLFDLKRQYIYFPLKFLPNKTKTRNREKVIVIKIITCRKILYIRCIQVLGGDRTKMIINTLVFYKQLTHLYFDLDSVGNFTSKDFMLNIRDFIVTGRSENFREFLFDKLSKFCKVSHWQSLPYFHFQYSSFGL